MKPTFLCIGVQKAGTTSLIHYLSQHPDVFMKNGESHYFDTVEPDVENIKAYENSFETSKRIVGEKTPSYNYLQYAMQRIYNYNPNLKLILILREPISRAFSQYNMTLESRKQTLLDVTDEQIMLAFEREINVKLASLTKNGSYYVARGKYDEMLTFIYSKFPRENVYVGIAEEIKADRQKQYNDIFHFLGAKPIPLVNKDAHIKTYARRIPKQLEQKLCALYKPHNARLYEILGRKIDSWENYYTTI
jgi:hypothetical protein